jgi:hypothetical protein
MTWKEVFDGNKFIWCKKTTEHVRRWDEPKAVAEMAEKAGYLFFAWEDTIYFVFSVDGRVQAYGTGLHVDTLD